MAGYGTDIPALGVDYFRGPLDSAGNEIGLSSFQYHIISGTDPKGLPTSALGFYRLISGSWPNNTPITAGGDGYDPGNTSAAPTPYVFPSFPNESGGGAWSMCSENLSGLDQRFLHTSGPFILKSGRTNEMISGVVWAPSIPDYPCPSLKPLVAADELAQNLFDNCFKITDGPDAPFIDIIEMDEELVLNLGYIAGQNNFELIYEESPGELRPLAVLGLDTTYDFQGYKIYQVNNPNLSVTELDDETQARLIFQSDVQDSVSSIVNWENQDAEELGLPVGTNVNVPTIMVEGENIGLKHTFRVIEDQFAPGEKKLINHKPYYFCVVAYAYNEYEKFDPAANTGQANPYLQGRRNFQIYTGIPRINDPEYSGIALNSSYGDQPGVTRYDGEGNGVGAFLKIGNRAAVETAALAETNVGEIVYTAGNSPIEVQVVDPLRVTAGTYRVYVCDENYDWNYDSTANSYIPMPTTVSELGDSTYWVLTDVNDMTTIWSSFQTMDWNYEQYVPDLGISVKVQQASKPGANGLSGLVGVEIEYATEVGADTVAWLAQLEDGEGIYNAIKTGGGEEDESFDPDENFSDNGQGWYPFMLWDAESRPTGYYLTAGHIGTSGANFRNESSLIGGKVRDTMLFALNNVNIVYTPDQSKWTRCMVVETASRYHGSTGLGLTIPSDRLQGEWKGRGTTGKPIYYSRNKDMSIDSSSVGMSWFPGYAYDVETGQRVNIFFGENSIYNGVLLPEGLNPGSNTGDDMIYNPTSTLLTGPFSFDENVSFLRNVLGGQHIVYVTRQPYDSCQKLIDMQTTVTFFVNHDNNIYPSMDITWAAFTGLNFGTNFTGSNGEVPPSEATIKLRVKRPHQIEEGDNTNLGYPMYEFSLDGLEPTKEESEKAASALDLMRIVPNPYYAYSDYEVTELENIIKITNIPAKCTIRIYSIDGRFVRSLSLGRVYDSQIRNGIARMGEYGNATIENQIVTSVDWDLKNELGVPVGSGVYLVHVLVPGVGERVIKSFIINRALDAQRL